MIEKHEALIRIVDRQGEIIPPRLFLPVAKKSKLYRTITRTIIKQAFNLFADTEMSVSINLTTRDLLDEDTMSFLVNEIQRTGMAGRVIVELVESESITRYEHIITRIRDLKNEGVLVAIDDFGSGYSNFNYILQVQADFLKIDGSLLEKIRTDHQSRIVVESIVTFAHKLGIKLVAEYVGDAESLAIIKEMGVQFAQGFFISEPLSGSDVIKNRKQAYPTAGA